MIYKNYRSDFNVRVSFSRISNGTVSAVPVPDHVRVEFRTHERYKPFIVERNGDRCSLCDMSSDGNTLIAHLSLSRHRIGRGQLFADVIVITQDSDFPKHYKEAAMIIGFDAILYSGKSGDGDICADAWGGTDSDISGLNIVIKRCESNITTIISGNEQRDTSISSLGDQLSELRSSVASAHHHHEMSDINGLAAALSGIQGGLSGSANIITEPEIDTIFNA